MNKRNVKNFAVGLISQIIILVLGFVVPRIILTQSGSYSVFFPLTGSIFSFAFSGTLIRPNR